MSEAPSLVLLARWRDSTDQAAAAELFSRYAGRLIALARSQMSGKLARRLDPADVVQSVCRSFFVRVRDGRLEIQPGSDLWQLLAAITMHKLLGQLERHTAGKRSIKREQEAAADSNELRPLEAVACEPAAEEVATVAEELASVLQEFSPLHRRIVELRLQEYTQAEIGQQTGRSERMVRLVLDRFAKRLDKRLRQVAEA